MAAPPSRRWNAPPTCCCTSWPPPSPTLGVTEIAEALGLSKAAVHRVLASLRSRDLIELDEDTRRYSLGLAAMKLGLTYLDRIDVRRIAHPFLMELCERTNETATLSIRAGSRRIYVDQITPPREVIMSIDLGTPYPLHAGASSRAFLAYLTDRELAEYLQKVPLESLTPGTITDAQALRSDLAQVRSQGFARSTAERKSGAASRGRSGLRARRHAGGGHQCLRPAGAVLAEFDTCPRHAAGDQSAALREVRLDRVITDFFPHVGHALRDPRRAFASCSNT